MKKLGFGCMRLPVLSKEDTTTIDLEQMCEMVDTFLDNGFTYFDTAYMYHNYMSERYVKLALVDRHPRDSFLLADKLPTMQLKAQEDVDRIFNEQLEKTGAGYFDYYLLHCLNVANYEAAEKYDCFHYVMQKKAEGKIKHVGFSYHDNAELLDEILTKHPEVEFVQLQLNYVDWDSDEIQSGKCYDVCVKHGKDVIVMEPVKGGNLVNIPEEAQKIMKDVNPDASIASWAIRYAASKEHVIMVLSGMSDLAQLKDNVSYMKDFVPFSKKEKETVEKVVKIINDTTKVPCTACRYCLEGCPMQIAIPEYFALYNEYYRFGNYDRAKQRYDNLTKDHGKASDCIACGQCEGHCPQHLSIIKYLAEIAETFEK